MNSKYRRKKNIIFQKIDNSTKILDEEQDSIVSLNEPASLLWNELSSFKSIDDLSKVLIESFNVDKKQSLIDINSFLELLRNHRFLDSKNEL
jgi:hypothetical protein